MTALPTLSAPVKTNDNQHAPETFNISDYTVIHRIKPGFVISRTHDGNILSLYESMKWDWSPYASGKKLVFRFEFEIDDDKNNNNRYNALVEELKLIFFLFLYSPIVGSSSSMHSPTQSALSGLKFLAEHAYSNNLTMVCLFKKPKIIIGFLNKHKCLARLVSPVIKGLNYYHHRLLNHPFERVSEVYIKKIRRVAEEYSKGNKQSPVIPSRIYSSLIEGVEVKLDSLRPLSSELLEFFQERAKNPAYGVSIASQKYVYKVRENVFPTFNEFIAGTNHLNSYFKIRQNKLKSLKSLIKLLSEIQGYCLITICLFTGMRIGEASQIPFYGSVKTSIEGVDHYLIKGFAEKQGADSEDRTEAWVTNKEGYEAFALAKKIAEVIYKAINIEPIEDEGNWHKTPLFISVDYLPGGATLIQNNTKYLSLASYTRICNCLRRFNYHITQEDFDELYLLDPHRDWGAEEGFRVGDRWNITTRQFRRTLAVYAQKSGLVSLPSLRRQLKHLTDEMSLYYASGSPLALDIVGDKESFSNLYRKTKPESQLMAMLKEFLFSDEKFFGATGTFARKNEGFSKQIIEDERKVTLKRFQKGELAYKETPFGACGEVADCDKKAMRSIVGCLSCSKSIISKRKLEKAIQCHETLVTNLDKKTVQYKIEKADLDEMNKALYKIQKGEMVES